MPIMEIPGVAEYESWNNERSYVVVKRIEILGRPVLDVGQRVLAGDLRPYESDMVTMGAVKPVSPAARQVTVSSTKEKL